MTTEITALSLDDHLRLHGGLEFEFKGRLSARVRLWRNKQGQMFRITHDGTVYRFVPYSGTWPIIGAEIA